MDIDKTDLSEEDKEKIKQQLYEEYMTLYKQIGGFPNQLDPDMIAGKKKLIPCRHEIIFNVTANVLEADETGNTIGTKEICTKNYHIPVPSDKDYHVYMKAFFDQLEPCLAQSAQNSKKETTNG